MNRAERDELARQAAAQAQVPPDWSGDKRLAVELAAAGLPDDEPAGAWWDEISTAEAAKLPPAEYDEYLARKYGDDR